MSNIEYVEGDLFGPIAENKDPNPIIIPHIVNSLGAWGKGFVVPLGRAYPTSRQNYMSWFNGTLQKVNATGRFGLGQTQFVNIDDKVFVANMVAQSLGGPRPLFYNHLSRCMDAVTAFVKERNDAREHAARIICPAFGSGLAGGDWSFIEQLIQDCWLQNNIPVTVYYLSGTLPEIESRSKNV